MNQEAETTNNGKGTGKQEVIRVFYQHTEALRGDSSYRSRSRSYSPPNKREREDRERVPNVGNNTQWQEPHLKKARLFVGNIDPNKVERCELIDIFSQYGNVLGVSVHKGFAFVQMDSERNANRAVNEENGSVINGQKIRELFH